MASSSAIMPSVVNHISPEFLFRASLHVNELNEIVAIVGSEGVYRGYYLAIGFKGGPCQYLCPRLALEACGVDVFANRPQCGIEDLSRLP